MGAFPDSLIKAIGKRAKLVAPILIASNDNNLFCYVMDMLTHIHNHKNENNNKIPIVIKVFYIGKYSSSLAKTRSFFVPLFFSL